MSNHVTQTGSNVLIEDHADNSIRVAATSLGVLDAADFLF